MKHAIELKVLSRVWMVMLTLSVFLGSAVVTPLNQVEARGLLKIGDYVLFASYLNQPILWRVIAIDRAGDPLLLSDRILSIKPFDAAGSLHPEKIGSSTVFRDRYGSSYWRHSNLRQWLNSSDASIKWWQNQPSPRNVWFEYNHYQSEKGFLAEGNFTSSERAAIKSVAQPSVLSFHDRQKKTGGEESFRHRTFVSDIIQNYDSAFYETINESVFLLSAKQVKEYVWDNRAVLGENYYFAKPTATAVQASTYKHSSLNVEQNYPYWLSTPAQYSNGNEVTVIAATKGYTFGDVTRDDPYDGRIGVRPALWLDLGLAFVKPGGSGASNRPYVINRGIDTRAPTVPTGLKMTLSTNDRIDVNWEPANDDFAVKGYEVFRDGTQVATTSSTSTIAPAVTPAPTTYSFVNLSDQTMFDVSVRAFDEAGNRSPLSAPLRVNTLDRTAPSTPTNLRQTELRDTSVRLLWNESQDAFGVSNYEVYRNGEWFSAVKENQVTVVNLLADRTYRFTIVAVDFSGNRSRESAMLEVRTLRPETQPQTQNPVTVQPATEIRVVGKDIFINRNRLNVAGNQSPVTINGVTMIPYRPIFEALGFQVQWFAGNRLIKATKDGVEIRMFQGRSTMWLQGDAMSLSRPPTIIRGTMMIPLRSLGENLQMKVNFGGRL